MWHKDHAHSGALSTSQNNENIEKLYQKSMRTGVLPTTKYQQTGVSWSSYQLILPEDLQINDHFFTSDFICFDFLSEILHSSHYD